MTAWTDEELAGIGGAEELRIAPLRRDGTLQRPRIIWVVRHAGDLYVRSVHGPDGAWFRGVQTRLTGHISAGGIEADVAFEDADHDLDDAIDEEYRRKYGRSSTAVDHITSPQARSTTIRLMRTKGGAALPTTPGRQARSGRDGTVISPVTMRTRRPSMIGRRSSMNPPL